MPVGAKRARHLLEREPGDARRHVPVPGEEGRKDPKTGPPLDSRLRGGKFGPAKAGPGGGFRGGGKRVWVSGPEGRWRGRGRVMRSGDVGSPNAVKRVRMGVPARPLPTQGVHSRKGGNRAGEPKPRGTPAFPNVPASREGSRAPKGMGLVDSRDPALDSHRPRTRRIAFLGGTEETRRTSSWDCEPIGEHTYPFHVSQAFRPPSAEALSPVSHIV